MATMIRVTSVTLAIAMCDLKPCINSAVSEWKGENRKNLYLCRGERRFLSASIWMTYNFLLCKRYLRRAGITPRRRFIARVRSRAYLSADTGLHDFSFISRYENLVAFTHSPMSNPFSKATAIILRHLIIFLLH